MHVSSSKIGAVQIRLLIYVDRIPPCGELSSISGETGGDRLSPCPSSLCAGTVARVSLLGVIERGKADRYRVLKYLSFAMRLISVLPRPQHVIYKAVRFGQTRAEGYGLPDGCWSIAVAVV